MVMVRVQDSPPGGRAESSASRKKLIVGIDYGTTYSGLGFALTSAADFKDIHTWTKYPGSSSHNGQFNVKAPSRVAYPDENDDMKDIAWGYQVASWMRSYSWTKLLLDDCALPAEHDDPALEDASSEGVLRLPYGKSAQDVVTDYLHGMFSMFESAMIEKFGKDNLANLPMVFWVTVPATWSDKAKMRTLAAAKAAGFASRPIDTLSVIPEPEAAAHAALKTTIQQVDDQIKVGESILICDCGGGTVDITTYKVLQTAPTLKLRELCVGIGGKCGGTFVDRNLHKLLSKRFGEAFTSLDESYTGPGSHFMSLFENIKKDFSAKDPSRRANRVYLPMPDLRAADRNFSQYYDKRFSAVLLTREDMTSLFDPVIDKIFGPLKDQVFQIREDKNDSVKEITLILVGGFGESPYLRERLAEWCEDWDAAFRTPLTGGWSAVVCGAVLRGLEGSAISDRKCRRHYGVACSQLYDPDEHGTDSHNWHRRYLYIETYTGCQFLSGCLTWGIAKGETVNESTAVNCPFFASVEQGELGSIGHSSRWKLYSCNRDVAPTNLDGDAIEEVGEIKFCIQPLDTTKLMKRQHTDGKTYCKVPMTVSIRLGDAAGVLAFRVLVEGKEVGTAQLDLMATVASVPS